MHVKRIGKLLKFDNNKCHWGRRIMGTIIVSGSLGWSNDFGEQLPLSIEVDDSHTLFTTDKCHCGKCPYVYPVGQDLYNNVYRSIAHSPSRNNLHVCPAEKGYVKMRATCKSRMSFTNVMLSKRSKMRHRVRVQEQKAHKWANQLHCLWRWYSGQGNPYNKSQDEWLHLEERKSCNQRETLKM